MAQFARQRRVSAQLVLDLAAMAVRLVFRVKALLLIVHFVRRSVLPLILLAARLRTILLSSTPHLAVPAFSYCGGGGGEDQLAID